MLTTKSTFLLRTCELIAKSADGKKVICIDKQNKHLIIRYINQSERHLKKWKHIVQLIMEGHKNTDLYDKEDINEKCKGITAMKFFKGQENDRIYCKELSDNGIFIIVIVEVYFKKKTKQVSKKEIPIIEKIAKYEYQIE